MTRERVRLAGLAGIAAAVLIVLAALLGEFVNDHFFALFVAAMILMAVGLIGFQARQRQRAGRLGRIGMPLIAIPLVMLAVLFGSLWIAEGIFGADVEAWEGIGATMADITVIVGFFTLLAGIVLFGIATIRANVLPRLAAILFVAGIPVALVIDISTGALGDEALTPYGAYIGFTMLAVGLAWMGYALWNEMRAPKEIEAGDAEVPVTGGE
jgi:hypothetical protein